MSPIETEHATPRTLTVLGAGNWGTTLAHLIGQNGYPVRLWARSPAAVAEINERHTHERYLSGMSLSANIEATSDLDEAVRDAELIFIVIPSQAFREVCAQIGAVVRPHQLAVHATKGLELGSYKRMTEIISEETCLRQLGVLSGPNIAREMCAGKPAGTVVASRFPRVVELAREVLRSKQLRVYGNTDVVGVELGGTLKNIIAIAAGMATQMELGENAKALLITRGLSEIARLGVALGADPMTFSGLAGIGDSDGHLRQPDQPQPSGRRGPGPRPDPGRGGRLARDGRRGRQGGEDCPRADAAARAPLAADGGGLPGPLRRAHAHAGSARADDRRRPGRHRSFAHSRGRGRQARAPTERLIGCDRGSVSR